MGIFARISRSTAKIKGRSHSRFYQQEKMKLPKGITIYRQGFPPYFIQDGKKTYIIRFKKIHLFEDRLEAAGFFGKELGKMINGFFEENKKRTPEQVKKDDNELDKFLPKYEGSIHEALEKGKTLAVFLSKKKS